MGQPRALQNARDGGHHASSAAGHRGAVLSIPHVARAEFAGAAVDNGQTCTADQGIQLPLENLIPNTEFTTAAGVVSNVEAAASALVAEDRNAGQAAE